MTAYTDIAWYYLALASPLALSASTAVYAEGDDAFPVAEALNDSVQRTIWNTDRLKEEEA